MDEISLLHRRHHKGFENLPSQNLVWKTCLRQIAFLPQNVVEVPFEEGDEIFSGQEAFAFLLEIICGLRSPIVGETEIFGQFKTFASLALENQNSLTLPLRGLFQSLIQTAKSVRAEHLVGLGSQGYGSLVRKLSKKDSAITLLGSGQLVEEILPWVAKEKTLQLVCRQPIKAHRLAEKYPSLKIDALATVEEVHATLVVAAPLTDAELLAWLQTRSVQKILDLRGELENPELFKDYQFIGLKDVFKNIEENKKDLSQRVITLKGVVQSRAQEYFERSLYRPYGWEDLCV